MKYKIVLFLILPICVQSQKIFNTFDIEAGGSSMLYSVGISTYFKVKDSSNIGFRMACSLFPMLGTTGNAKVFIPSLQLFYNPSNLFNGKWTFRAGTSFYFMDSYSSNGYDPVNEISFYSYSPASVANSFNLGSSYNILKKNSKLSLNLGLDLIIAFRDIHENHIDIPVVPWPIIQYGIKF